MTTNPPPERPITKEERFAVAKEVVWEVFGASNKALDIIKDVERKENELASVAREHEPPASESHQALTSIEHCGWCERDYDFVTQSIHCPHAYKGEMHD